MSKVKSRIFTMITVILILILISVLYKAHKNRISSLEDINFNERNLYSLEDIEKMLNEIKLPENYKLKETILDKNDSVINENEYYMDEKSTNSQMNAINTAFALIDLAKKQQSQYMCEGKEKLNDKNCIKISFDSYSGVAYTTIFYIDENLHCIYKMEYYLRGEARKPITKKINYVYNTSNKLNTYIYDYILEI